MDALTLALVALRTGLNVCSLLLIGLGLHGALGIVQREALTRWRRFAIALAAATIALAFARLPLLNVQMGDTSTLLDPDLMALGWMTLGSSSLAFAVGAALVVAGFVLSQRVITATGALVTASGFALTGHTQALADPGIAPFAVGLHTALAGFWITAPLTLVPRTATSSDLLLTRLQRFSAVAVLAIPLLIIVGVWLAWTLAGGLEGLLQTAYGQLLLVKLAAAAGALSLGAFNQRIVTAKVRDDPPVGRRWLQRTLVIESSLFAAAILAISAATTLTGAGERPVAERMREFPSARV